MAMEHEEDEDCPEDCYHCLQAYRKREAEMAADREAAHQKKLWGPGGILFDEDDPICQSYFKEE